MKKVPFAITTGLEPGATVTVDGKSGVLVSAEADIEEETLAEETVMAVRFTHLDGSTTTAWFDVAEVVVQ